MTATGKDSSRLTGVCTAAIDGDSILVETNGLNKEVRLAAIDSPDRGQAFYHESKERLEQICVGNRVTVEIIAKVRNGHFVGFVAAKGGEFTLNRRMVRNGYAWWYRQYAPSNIHLEADETVARARKLGLWSQEKPVPPWSFSGKVVPGKNGMQ